jgi:hypothetical protein
MVLTIDTLGKRYGMLPSEIMKKGSTWDIFVMDAALSYEQHKNDEAMKKYNNQHIEAENKPLTDETMMAAYTKFKEGNNG